MATSSPDRPFLIDVTRLISRSWTRRQSTGIDRVCYAYLKYLRTRALAVVQHRGIVRTLGPRRSDQLFDMLLAPARHFRTKFVPFAPAVLGGTSSDIAGKRLTYINVSHTDFDLELHHRWTQQSQLRSIYLIHDLIPILHPELSRPHAVNRHLGRVTSALQNGDGIIVSSHSVADSLASFADEQGLPVPPLVVAPLAGAELKAGGVTGGANTHATAGKHASTNDPYFVCIGTIEPRKNHQLLIDVWRALAERLGKQTPKLFLVGQTGPMSGDVLSALAEHPEIAPYVKLITKCSDAHLGDLLADARALLMPTLAEGFGLPLVEALQSGTPVIASDIPIFCEIGQSVPLLLDPLDIAAWENAILGYVDDAPDRERQLAKMPKFQPAIWDDHFAQVERWLDGPQFAAGRNSRKSQSKGDNDACLNA